MQKLSNNDLHRVDIDTYKKATKENITIVLDNVRSMHNVGSIFRTADAFNIEKIILCGITATPPHREIAKTALGATESVQWAYEAQTQTAIEKLKNEAYTIACVEQVKESVMLHEITYEKNEKIALIFGNEVEGVQQKIVESCDIAIEIPQFGTKHSFNISISVGIVLWHLYYAALLKK
jgi:23S rRNA (guanosine2251-2'-O)-methyltransferase